MTMSDYAFTRSISSARRGGVVLSAVLLVGGTRPCPAPLRLAIYYGYPSLVNGTRGNLAQAVAHFSNYDLVVLGDGLEFDTAAGGHAGRAEHEFTVELIRQLRVAHPQAAVFGYVDLGRTQQLSSAEIVDRIGRWATMGAAGVFLDEAGYDFGVTRERQNLAVSSAHRQGLRVCMNAFQPLDVFGEAVVPLNGAGGGNPTGISPLISARDAVLLEAFAVKNGTAETLEGLTARVSAALEGRDRFGSQVFGIATGADEIGRLELAQYGWWMSSVFGLDAYGWAMPDYGAVASQLPWVPRPEAEATLRSAAYIDEAPEILQGRWRRATSLGTIVVDSRSHRGALESRTTR
jgi:hypothetical protein